MDLSVTLKNNNGPILGCLAMERQLIPKKDLKIVCNDGTLEWSSLLMSTWAKVARTFLMEEKVSLCGEKNIMLLIPDIKKATMKQVLDWSVTGEITLANHNAVGEVMWALQSLGSSAQLSVVPGALTPARGLSGKTQMVNLTAEAVGAEINTDGEDKDALDSDEKSGKNVRNSSTASSPPDSVGDDDPVKDSGDESFNRESSVEENEDPNSESDMAHLTGSSECVNFSRALSRSMVSESPNDTVQKADSSTEFTGTNAVKDFIPATGDSSDMELGQDDKNIEVDIGEDDQDLPDLDGNNVSSRNVLEKQGQLSPEQLQPSLDLKMSQKCENTVARFSTGQKKDPKLKKHTIKNTPGGNISKNAKSIEKVKCLLCDKSLPTKTYNQMSRHLCGTHYRKKILDQYGEDMACPICKKQMPKDSRYNTHNIDHLGVQHDYIRSLVPQVIRDQMDQLRRKGQKYQPKQDMWGRCKAHFLSVDKSEWSCCHSFAGSPQELRLHLARVHYADELVAIYGSPDSPCQLCNSDSQHTVTDRRGVVLHMASSHPSSIYALMPEEEGNLLKACFKTNKNHLKIIKDHVKIKSKGKTYIRKNVGLTASSSGPKSSHKSGHKSSGFQCPLCPFRDKKGLRCHLATKHYREEIFTLANFSESSDCSLCKSLWVIGSRKKNVKSYKLIRHLGLSHGYLDRIMPREVAENVG